MKSLNQLIEMTEKLRLLAEQGEWAQLQILEEQQGQYAREIFSDQEILKTMDPEQVEHFFTLHDTVVQLCEAELKVVSGNMKTAQAKKKINKNYE